MGPLPESGQMIFKALQTYSDGTVVRWIDEPSTDGTEPESPAPVLKIVPAAAAGSDSAAAATGPTAVAEPASDSSGSSGFGIAGLVAGVLALIVAMLAYARAARRPGGRHRRGSGRRHGQVHRGQVASTSSRGWAFFGPGPVFCRHRHALRWSPSRAAM